MLPIEIAWCWSAGLGHGCHYIPCNHHCYHVHEYNSCGCLGEGSYDKNSCGGIIEKIVPSHFLGKKKGVSSDKALEGCQYGQQDDHYGVLGRLIIRAWWEPVSCQRWVVVSMCDSRMCACESHQIINPSCKHERVIFPWTQGLLLLCPKRHYLIYQREVFWLKTKYKNR